MKPGPFAITREIVSRMDISAEPRSIVEVIAVHTQQLGWHKSGNEAREIAERWKSAVLKRLREELDQLNRTGRFCPYAFNSSSPDYLQGAAFIEPRDSVEVKDAKRKRAHFSSYLNALRGLSPRDFEVLCSGVLNLLGVEAPIVTPYSADEGIDFYGKLNVGERLLRKAVFPWAGAQMSIWLVGQAKHYLEGQVSTPDIRGFVGSVELAKAHTFGVNDDKYPDLSIKVCDAVFFLFFTTGRISSNGWTLLENSGVIAMDGEMVVAFLADQGVGLRAGEFVLDELLSWMSKFRI